jgi:hypothetical protein
MATSCDATLLADMLHQKIANVKCGRRKRYNRPLLGACRRGHCFQKLRPSGVNVTKRQCATVYSRDVCSAL